MNKKGFTLIELLVCITLLMTIGLILAVSLNGLMKNQDKKACRDLEERIVTATDVYINKYENMKPVNQEKTIFLKSLVDEGLLKESELINPITKNKIVIDEVNQGRVILNIHDGIINYQVRINENDQLECE